MLSDAPAVSILTSRVPGLEATGNGGEPPPEEPPGGRGGGGGDEGDDNDPSGEDLRLPDQPDKPRNRWRTAIEWGLVIGGALLVALIVRTFFIQAFWIPSESMEPTLHGCSGCNNDRLLVDKLSYRLHAVHRGDVVVFHRPPGVDAPENVLIKRVIGLPGETVYDGATAAAAPPLPRPVNSVNVSILSMGGTSAAHRTFPCRCAARRTMHDER